MRRSLGDAASLRMWHVAIMVLALLDMGCMAVAAEPPEDPTNILAAQLRNQGYNAIGQKGQNGMFTPPDSTKRCG